MSSKSKGDKAEREVYKILESRGWLVNPAPRTMRRIFIGGKIRFVSGRNDIFKLFDGIAKQNKTTQWFQVKSTSSGVSGAKKKIAEFAEKECNSRTEICTIWHRVPRKGFVIHGYNVESGKWDKEFYNLKGEHVEQFKVS